MPRLIDADALKIKVLKWMPSDPCGIEEREFPFEADIVASLMMEIEEAPTIEPEPHWISCSEKLPEYRKLVDVTTRDLRVKLAYLDSIEEDGTDDLWIIPLEDAECALWNVVAWKQRSEPWKGKSNK